MSSDNSLYELTLTPDNPSNTTITDEQGRVVYRVETVFPGSMDADEEAWFSFDDLSGSSEDSESVDLSRLLDELEEEEAILLGQVRTGGLTTSFLPSIAT